MVMLTDRECANLKTLGDRVKRARNKLGLRIIDVASKARSTIKTVSNIEKGECKSRKKSTIAKLAEALEVSFSEEVYWYGLAGFIPMTKWPSTMQIIDVLEDSHKDTLEYPFPAYVLSTYFEYMTVNPAVAGLVGSIQHLKALLRSRISVFDLMFNNQYKIFENYEEEDFEYIQREQIRRAFAINWNRRHEAYFQNIQKLYEKRLSESGHNKFLKFFNEQADKNIKSTLLSKEERKGALGYIDLQIPSQDEVLNLRITNEPIYELGGLFCLVHYRPASMNNYDKYKEYFSQFKLQSESESRQLKIWNYIDMLDIIRDYQGR